MKANGFLGLMLILLLGGAAFQISVNSNKSIEKAKHIKTCVSADTNSTGKILRVTQIANELKHIDSVQQGLCDTCVSGVTSAVISNRLVVNNLVKKTILLQKLCDSLDRQIEKVNMVLNRLKRSPTSAKMGDLTARVE
jgi:hypothetical protein